MSWENCGVKRSNLDLFYLAAREARRRRGDIIYAKSQPNHDGSMMYFS